jgi:hypothetical protein
LGTDVKSETLAPPLGGYDGASPSLVRALLVRRVVAETWWVSCLLPAVVLLVVAVTA